MGLVGPASPPGSALLATIRPPSRHKDRKLLSSVDNWEWLAVEQGRRCGFRMSVGTSREGLGPACLEW